MSPVITVGLRKRYNNMGNGKESDTVEIQPFDSNDIAMSDHDKLQMCQRAVRATTAQKFSKDLIGFFFATWCANHIDIVLRKKTYKFELESWLKNFE
jgi:hypothetical protein